MEKRIEKIISLNEFISKLHKSQTLLYGAALFFKIYKRKDFEYSAKYHIKGSFPKVFLYSGQKLSKERYQIIFIDIDTTFIFNCKVRSSFVNSLYESFSIFNCRQL